MARSKVGRARPTSSRDVFEISPLTFALKTRTHLVGHQVTTELPRFKYDSYTSKRSPAGDFGGYIFPKCRTHHCTQGSGEEEKSNPLAVEVTRVPRCVRHSEGMSMAHAHAHVHVPSQHVIIRPPSSQNGATTRGTRGEQRELLLLPPPFPAVPIAAATTGTTAAAIAFNARWRGRLSGATKTDVRRLQGLRATVTLSITASGRLDGGLLGDDRVHDRVHRPKDRRP